MGSRALSASAVRWTLVLPVLCGVLAMHALVLGHSSHITAAFASHGTATAAIPDHPAPPASAPGTAAVHGTATDAMAAIGTAAPATHRTVSGSAPTDLTVDGAPTPVPAEQSPAGHSPAGNDHGLLHLCLAVLTLLAGLLAAPLLARLVLPTASAPGPVHGRGAATAPAAPPPPSAVRLARLCLLRT